MEPLSETTCGNPCTKQVFIPQETLDHPFDVTLVVEDGKEFKAHRRVLSEASPFFQNMLNSDMRESNEGVVRLEMLTKLGISDILEFIYTGTVQISDANNAQELLVMADYLDLSKLKSVAEKVLLENLKLNASNAISTLHFAGRYGCEQLMTDTRRFLMANFTAVTKTEDFLNMSSREVKMLISSDEIAVSAEEDVFKAILKWTYHERSERKKYFAELFREVRLVYVSRYYLHSDVVTNDLVNDNEGCISLVKEAMNALDVNIDSKSYFNNYSVKPRKSLEVPVLLVYLERRSKDRVFYLYYPRYRTWSRFSVTLPPDSVLLPTDNIREVIPCGHGKLHFIQSKYPSAFHGSRLCYYDSSSDNWLSLNCSRSFHKVFVRNDEIYALVSENQPDCCVNAVARGDCRNNHRLVITKYNPESNSWEDISSFDLGLRHGICIVAKDNFVYVLGGRPWKALTNAERYDLTTNSWNKIADLQEKRSYAKGAAGRRKIFILGGEWTESCEVYNEKTNEWQLIASLSCLNYRQELLVLPVCVDDRLFVLTKEVANGCSGKIMSYDPRKNDWKEETQIPDTKVPFRSDSGSTRLLCCSMKVFKASGIIAGAAMEGPRSSELTMNLIFQHLRTGWNKLRPKANASSCD